MTEKILVDFQGVGAGTAELTWGQRTVWRVVARTGQSETLGGVVALPAGTTVDDSVEILRYVVGRHQSLRTKFRPDGPGGDLRQHVFESGQVALAVLDAGEEDPAAFAEEVMARYEAEGFDHENEWPVRMAVVLAGGVATHSVAVYNHLALDAHGMDALIADLADLDPATGEPRGPMTATQPLALAEQQRKPNVLRNAESALRYWERVLRTVSPRRIDGEVDETRTPHWGFLEFTSSAALLATQAIAARIGTDSSPVLLAAYAVGLARTIGNNPVALQVAVNNRFRSALLGSVSTMAQTCPLMIDVADVDFAEAVNRARQATMVTYKYAYYDPERRAAMVDAVKAELGGPVEMDCYFNDRRPPAREERLVEAPAPEEVRAALAKTTAEWVGGSDLDNPLLYLNVDELSDAVRFTLKVDLHRASPAQWQSILDETEAVLVAAALDPAAGTGVRA